MIEIGHLDLNIVEHCNMSCVSCSHASPVASVRSMDLETIERDLERLKPILKCHSLNVVGGEPTLHKKIVEILRLLKRIKIGGTVVITNGTLLDRMKEDFWSELEYLSISVYPTLDHKMIRLAEEKQQRYQFGLGTRSFHEFHRQIREPPSDGSNFTNCHWKSDCYTVHEGYFYLCPQSAFFPKRFMGLSADVDGISLGGITEQLLFDYIHRTEPFNACRICMANEMSPKPWTESRRDMWLEESKC